MIQKGVSYPYLSQGLNQDQYADFESNVRTLTIPLDAARNDVLIYATSSWLFVSDSSVLAANCQVRFNNYSGDLITLKRGLFLPFNFTKLYVTNTAQANDWIEIILGIGINQFLPPMLSVQSQLCKGGEFHSLADVTCTNAGNPTLILPYNVNRSEAIIRNLRSNVGPNPVRIGDAGAAAAEGHELDIAETIILSTNSALYCHNPNAGDQILSICYIE